MKKEKGRLIVMGYELKRTLMKCETALELYCDDSTPESLEMFIDCKLELETALDYTKDMLNIIKNMKNN